MDTGEGTFMRLTEENIDTALKLYPGHGGIFREGEEVELKGSSFVVSKILQNGLKLKLLSKGE